MQVESDAKQINDVQILHIVLGNILKYISPDM